VVQRISDRAWGWIGPVSVATLAFLVRIWHVGRPNRLLFDETYYAKDAWSLLHHGYVLDFVEDANTRIQHGDLTGLTTQDPSWVVHPEGGRLMIAAGERLFGLDAFGWRIAAVLAGALTVLVLARLVRRLTGSTWAGCLAGLLLCFDGAHFVLSRLALLDIFLAFWLVCGVACLAAARDAVGIRYRFWQLGAGVTFGLACATKWSGVYGLAVFGLLFVILETVRRRPTPARWPLVLLKVGIPAFVIIVGTAFVVYLLTWTGWLIHHEAFEARFGHGYGTYSKPWGSYLDRPATGFLGETRDALRSLWHFHVMTYDFHTQGLNDATHPYQSNPIGWLLMERPVGVDAVNDLPAARCGAPVDSSCMRVTTILGNPAVWWIGTAATVGAIITWIRSREGRWLIPVVGVLSGWLPWFANADRPIFSFYAVTVLPFMVIAIAMLAHAWVGQAHTPRQRYGGWLATGLYLAVVIGLFIYFRPILTDQLVPYDTWHSRMWFPRWI